MPNVRDINLTELRRGIDIARMEEFVNAVAGGVKLPSIDYYPVWGKQIIRTKEPKDVFIPYGINYLEPPVVIPIVRSRRLLLQRMQYKLRQFKAVVEELPRIQVEEQKLKIVGMQSVKIPPPQVIIPSVTIEGMKELTTSLVTEIKTEGLNVVDKIKKIELQLPSFSFPPLPRIGVWSVEWFKVTSTAGSSSPITPDAPEATTPSKPSATDTGLNVTVRKPPQQTTATIDEPINLDVYINKQQQQPPASTRRTPVVSRRPTTTTPPRSTRPVVPRFTATFGKEKLADLAFSFASELGEEVTFEPIEKTELNGLFTLSFSKGAKVIGNLTQKVGFIATTTLELEKETTLIFTVGGKDGFRLKVDGDTVINKWGLKKIPDIATKKLTLTKGTHTLELSWYVWTGVPFIMFSILPPAVPKLPRPADLSLDLGQTMREAFISAYLFTRDKLNEIYEKNLPTWEVDIPEIRVDYEKVLATIGGKEIKVSIHESLFPGLGIEMNLAKPFVFSNSVFFNTTKPVPGWFGKIMGDKLGAVISSVYHSTINAIKGVYTSLTEMVKNAFDILGEKVESFAKETEQKIEDFASEVQDQFNEKFGELSKKAQQEIDAVKNETVRILNEGLSLVDFRSDKRFSEGFTQLTDSINKEIPSAFKGLASDIETNVNNAIKELTEEIETQINAAMTSLTTSINKAFDLYSKSVQATIERTINEAMAYSNKQLNSLLNTYIPNMLRQMGLPEDLALSPAYLIEVKTDGFVMRALSGTSEVHWFAIGKVKPGVLFRGAEKAVETARDVTVGLLEKTREITQI